MEPSTTTQSKQVPRHRFYSTIGIDDVFLEPPDQALFPQHYLNSTNSASFVSPEIVGKLKCSPEDFIVREIAKKDRVISIPGALLTEEEKKAFQVADLVDIRPPKKKEEDPKDPNVKNEYTTSKQQQEGSANDSKPNNSSAPQNDLLEMTNPVEVLRNVLITATKGDDQTKQTPDEVIESLKELQAKSLERIQTLCDSKTADDKEEAVSVPTTNITLSFAASSEDNPSTLDKGAFHKAIRFAFSLLQSKSDSKSNDVEVFTDDFFDDLVPFLYKPQEDLPKLYQFHKRGCLVATIKHASRQSSKGHNHSNKRKRDRPDPDAPEGALEEPVLRLKPDLSKDARRAIHHLLSTKNRAFQSNTLSDYPLDTISDTDNSNATTSAILVFWGSGAQKRARKKYQQGAQKRDKKGKNSNNNNTLPHTLCVVKKREREHLSAITALCAALKCRTGDVGLAGIKDMKAVTYQYCTLRNMGPMRLFKAMPDLKRKGIELGTIQKVDFFLQTGELEGNRFDITLRDIQRVQVSASGEEKLCPCDKQHLKDAFERVQRFGFVNFFGEQRVGAPGETADVGVRTFDIGRAMLQGDFSKAIDLIMIGRSLTYGRKSKEDPNETRVRKAWKESGGDPAATLKEFPKGENMPRERALMKGLNRYGKSEPLAAIQCLPYNVRRFWINAYQSFVWNTMASARLKRYGMSVVVGDLYQDGESNGAFDVKVVNPDNLSTVTFEQVVLPLPGFAVQYPENGVGSGYLKLLGEDGVAFEKQGDDEKTAKGAYRPLIVKVDNMHLKLDDDDSKNAASTMNIQFDLSAGCYATMLLRELMFTTVARD